MIHLDISRLYSELTDAINALTSSIITHSSFKGVRIRSLITKHRYRHSAIKNKNMNMFGLDDNYFYMDVFIESLIVDDLADYMHWCGDVKSTEAMDYLLANITESTLTIDQYNLLKNVMVTDNFFQNTFLNKVSYHLEEVIDDSFSLDDKDMTWDILSASVSASMLTIESLGDWRIEEYMRLLGNGALSEEYNGDPRRSNISHSIETEKSYNSSDIKNSDQDELTKDELIYFNDSMEALRSDALKILESPGKYYSNILAFQDAGILTFNNAVFEIDECGLSAIAKNSILKQRSSGSNSDSVAPVDLSVPVPLSKVIDRSIIAEEATSEFKQD